jgi:hypothetical protein
MKGTTQACGQMEIFGEVMSCLFPVDAQRLRLSSLHWVDDEGLSRTWRNGLSVVLVTKDKFGTFEV